MQRSETLYPGAIIGLDHVTLPCEASDLPRLTAFWEALGLSVQRRDQDRRIDHAGPGTRWDVGTVSTTYLTYYVVSNDTNPDSETTRAVRDRHLAGGHLAFAVDPGVIRSLRSHPDLDRSQGDNGLIRWGIHDFSVFLNAPHGLRVEFRCPSAPADLDDLLD